MKRKDPPGPRASPRLARCCPGRRVPPSAKRNPSGAGGYRACTEPLVGAFRREHPLSSCFKTQNLSAILRSKSSCFKTLKKGSCFKTCAPDSSATPESRRKKTGFKMDFETRAFFSVENKALTLLFQNTPNILCYLKIGIFSIYLSYRGFLKQELDAKKPSSKASRVFRHKIGRVLLLFQNARSGLVVRRRACRYRLRPEPPPKRSLSSFERLTPLPPRPGSPPSITRCRHSPPPARRQSVRTTVC